MIPLYGILEGDTLALLIFAYPDETMDALAKKLENAAAVRVLPKARLKLLFNGVEMRPTSTVSSVGFAPLDLFKVVEDHRHVT